MRRGADGLLAALGHSRHGLLLPVVGRLPQCPESGRKVRASASVAMGQTRHSGLSFDHLVGARHKARGMRSSDGVSPESADRLKLIGRDVG